MQATLDFPSITDISNFDPASEMYQAVGLLEFRRDAVATGLVIDEFVLDGDFKAINVNVLAQDAPLKAQLEKPDATTWVVRLPGPMPLERINVQEIRFAQMDLAEEFIAAGFFDYMLPAYELSVGAAAVVLDKSEQLRARARTDFQAGREWAIASEQLDIFPVIGDKIMDQSIATVGNNAAISQLILDAFAIRAKEFTGRNLLVARHGISVYVHSQPQGLNLDLAPVTHDGPVLDELTSLGGFNLASNQDTVALEDGDAAWRTGLQDFVDRHYQSDGSGTVFQAAVVLRSENPCQFETVHSMNSYRLVFRDTGIFPGIHPADPDSPVEQRQGFPGTQWHSYDLQLSLPPDSVLQSAVLPFRQMLKRSAFSFVGEPPSEQWLASAKGVELTTDQWAGGIFQLDKARSVRYLLLPVMATAAQSACAIEIREDINGAPSGAIITQQTLSLPDAGVRAWMSVALDEAIPLYGKKLWWLVKTTQGSAVQFVDEDPDGSGIVYFSLSESGGPGSVFRFTAELCVRPLFAMDSSDGARLHAFLADGNDWLPVGSTEQSDSNLQQFDLLPLLSSQSQTPAINITLRLATLLKGNAVLYPPEISYELSDQTE